VHVNSTDPLKPPTLLIYELQPETDTLLIIQNILVTPTIEVKYKKIAFKKLQ
jgi:hypothetical protein